MSRRFASAIRAPRSRTAALLTAGSFLLAFLAFSCFPEAFVHWNNRFRDQHFKLRYRLLGTQAISPHLIPVMLNDTGREALGLRRGDAGVFGQVIGVLQDASPRVIACDVLVQDRGSWEDDELLLRAASGPHPVVFPVLVYPLEPGSSEAAVRTQGEYDDLGSSVLVRPGIVRGGEPPEAARLAAPFLELSELAGGLGHINVRPDRDGVTRRVNLVYSYQQGFVPALSLRALVEFYEVAQQDVEVSFGRYVILRNARVRDDTFEDVTIPIDRQGRIIVNFPGPWGDSFRHYPVHKVLAAANDPQGASQLYDLVDGSLVIVSDVSSATRDYGTGIFESVYVLSGLHMSVINSVLTGAVLHDQTLLVSAAIALGFAAALWLSAAALPGPWFSLSCMGLYVLFYLVHFSLFVAAGSVPALAAPTLGFAGAVLSIHVLRLILLQRDRSALLASLAANRKLEAVNRELVCEKRKLEVARAKLQELVSAADRGSTYAIAGKAMGGKAPPLDPPGDPGRIKHPEAFEEIITGSQAMLSVFRRIEAFAASSHPVLVTGESGVGKELAARAIHRLSGRNGKFVCENVAGLDDAMFTDTLFGHARGAFTDAESARRGLVEQAAAGTLFLDEIGDLSLASQVKLLRFIEEKEYRPLGTDQLKRSDARVIIATNSDLQKKLEEGTFREDLFFRLTHVVHIPALRERLEDLPLLIDHFVAKTCRALGIRRPSIPAGLAPMLGTYSFPGNVRELKNMIENALARSESSEVPLTYFVDYLRAGAESGGADLAAAVSGAPRISLSGPFPTLKDIEKTLVAEALRRTGGNQNLAARLLGLSPSALSRRITRGGIEVPR
ncbi:MAG: sigma 54-interacting transcriptional regulator [Spirochaetales bacterium]|nr:sigma 54-interacting transcriptional regulator [Spirochaetales bacterium]